LSGRLAAGTKPIEESLKKAGIKLKVTTHREWDPHFEALGNPAKRLEHQLAQSGWILDYLGDNARQSIVPRYDSRLDPVVSGNFSEYDNPKVNRLIDRALAEPTRTAGPPCGPRSTSGSCATRPWSRWCGRTPRSSGPPGSTAGDTTPGRPGPTSPPSGWTPQPPDRGLSPGRPGADRRGDQPRVAAHSADLRMVRHVLQPTCWASPIEHATRRKAADGQQTTLVRVGKAARRR
jgi:hypothetical protein